VSAALLQPVALCAAFWTALLVYGRRAGPVRSVRFALALALGALLAHLGWALLHWDAVREHPTALLDPLVGSCVLFVPLGPLLLERSSAAFASLPLALAVARLGCVAAGCCHGTPTAVPWAVAGLHPTSLYEITGLLALHGVVSRANERFRMPLALGGIGGLRLVVDSLRVSPPLGLPLIPASGIAAAWVALAVVLASAPMLSRRAARQRGKRAGSGLH